MYISEFDLSKTSFTNDVVMNFSDEGETSVGESPSFLPKIQVRMGYGPNE